MGRPKLPVTELKETVGIKLPPSVIRELESIGEKLQQKPSAVGREMLLLGLSVYKATGGSKIFATVQPGDELEPIGEGLPNKNN